MMNRFFDKLPFTSFAMFTVHVLLLLLFLFLLLFWVFSIDSLQKSVQVLLFSKVPVQQSIKSMVRKGNEKKNVYETKFLLPNKSKSLISQWKWHSIYRSKLLDFYIFYYYVNVLCIWFGFFFSFLFFLSSFTTNSNCKFFVTHSSVACALSFRSLTRQSVKKKRNISQSLTNGLQMFVLIPFFFSHHTKILIDFDDKHVTILI